MLALQSSNLKEPNSTALLRLSLICRGDRSIWGSKRRAVVARAASQT